ncbi:MAG: type II CAAX endopeptidase family protein [Acidaminobacteraceae bacterium]
MKEIKQINSFYLIIMLSTIIFGSIFSNIIPKGSLVISQLVFLLIPATLFIKQKKLNLKESFSLKKFNPINLPLILFLTILMQYPLAAVSQLSAYIFGDQLAFIFDDVVSRSSFSVLFLSLALLPAICEEIFFRGLIFNRYKNRVSMKTLIVMNSLLFAIFHLNIQQFSYAFLFGIVVSLVVYLTDSIYPAMIMHFFSNFLSVIEMKFPNSYFSILDYILPKGEGMFYVGMMIILSIFSSVVIYVVLVYMAKFNGRSMIEYGVFEQLESVSINFDETPKENIIDSMKRFEAQQPIEVCDKKAEKIESKNRFLNIREVFSWHIGLSIFIFIVFSTLVVLASNIA